MMVLFQGFLIYRKEINKLELQQEVWILSEIGNVLLYKPVL